MPTCFNCGNRISTDESQRQLGYCARCYRKAQYLGIIPKRYHCPFEGCNFPDTRDRRDLARHIRTVHKEDMKYLTPDEATTLRIFLAGETGLRWGK